MPRTGAPAKRARSQDVYDRMRADIFAARLSPGERLKFPQICERYQASVSVAREALTRLSLERLVTSQPHQGGLGYAVSTLSRQSLTDLSAAREEIEPAAARLSVLHGTPGWEASLVAAHHLLARLDVPRTGATDDAFAEWSVAHEAFHSVLLDGCPSERLRLIAGGLREEAELYRRWAVPIDTGGAADARDVAGEHRDLLQAALAREADRTAELLRAHLSRTTHLLLMSPDAAEAVPPRLAADGA